MIKKEIKNNLGLITVNQSQLNWCLDFGPGPHERDLVQFIAWIRVSTIACRLSKWLPVTVAV